MRTLLICLQKHCQLRAVRSGGTVGGRMPDQAYMKVFTAYPAKAGRPRPRRNRP